VVFLNKINNFLGHFIPITTPLAVVFGFLFSDVFSFLRPFVPWLFAVMTFSGAIRLKASELTDAVKKPIPIFLFFFTSHVIMPITALFLSSFFITNHDIITGFVILFAGPTAVSGFIWVIILKGDKALWLSLILLDTALAPIVVPVTVYLLRGADVIMDTSGIVISLLFMVVIPTIIGVTINEVSKGKAPEVIGHVLDPLSKIFLMCVIAANTSAVASFIRFNDPVVWKTAIFCILLTTTGFLLARLNGIIGKCNDERKTALIISGGLRNNSAVMTIAVTFFPEMTVLPTLLSIIFQQTIMAIMGRVMIKKK
jgi:predicted Na+-dependent transporter